MEAASLLTRQMSPLGLHLLALGALFALARLFRAKSVALRLAASLLFFGAILSAGSFKVGSDENIFRLLRVSRKPAARDIQAGLDRLEGQIDDDTILEMENALTGSAAAYHFRGSLLVSARQ